MSPRLISFSDSPAEPEAFAPAADRVLSGNPQQIALNHYEGAGGRLLSGEWRCEPGAWRLVYDEDEYEFCQILEGHIRLTDAAGVAREFHAGDAFVIEAGFRGVWETIRYCRKHYVICRIA
ncbi:cupin domain-containing protein [Niveibacterium sp. 24ML]|uniref:cupin domain-containing protein n=1 Tax=Niveibacterium sp. 24ML TaxID=2985512 RepID=UPI00226F880E|nr:cupin domain-containing protein [Niveibacterium sp. 24ML]MCX9156409.1 cupin domain-containing protein [Niveibacterium sp. 24ML]